MSDDKPVNPAKEKTTWGEVCKQVGFADNLYRTCRGKLGNGFSPAAPFGETFASDGDEGGELDEDFDKQLKKSALPVPPPPADDWKHEPEGFLDGLLHGESAGKWFMWGGAAVVAFLLWRRFFSPAAAPAASSTLSASTLPAPALPASTPIVPLLPVDNAPKSMVG